VAGQESTDGGQQLLLGKKLLERGLITPDQLREALVERARLVAGGDSTGAPLGGILVSKGFLTDAQLVDALADNSRTPLPPGSSSAVSLPTTAPSVPQDPATTHLGKYALVRELGRGGMGVVYEAVDTQLDRKVALKLLLVNPNLDAKDRQLEQERFVQEAQLSAKLKHPNIVTVYEAGILEGRQFLAMELVEGRPFGEWRQGVTVREQVALIRDVALAVHHAHEQGILHRDLKPRNILIGPANRPFVTDFGLAKSMGAAQGLSLTGSGAVVGTPAYMSPEQAQGLDRIDWRTDIYSLGVILYEIMTGRPPFQGESPIEILMKVVKDPVVPPLQVVDGGSALGLDKNIESICLKALAKKDRDRYATAQAFADDLAKWLQGDAVAVPLPKARKPAAKGRIRVLPIAILVLVALLAGGAGAWFFLGGLSFVRPPVEENLQKARQFMAQGDFQQARVYFNVVRSLDPSNAEAKAGEEDAARRLTEKTDKEKKAEEELGKQLVQKQAEHEQFGKTAKERGDAAEIARSESERARLLSERKDALEKQRKLREDLDRLLAKLKRAPGPDISTAVPVDATWKGAVSLLPLVDPVRHVVWGTWGWQDDKLVSDRWKFARLEIPYEAPEEYDLRLAFSRQSGTDAVVVLFPAYGRLMGWESGGAGNTASGFQSGEALTPAPEGAPRGLQNDRVYTLQVEVRRDSLLALLNGQEVGGVKGGFAGVAAAGGWRLRNSGSFGLGSHGSPTVFHGMHVRDVTGKGRKSPGTPGLVLRSTPVGFGTLKPGVIAEYYYGANFEALAVRRHETGLSYFWGESNAWAGGPADSFSTRFRGYLQISRPARYVFQLSADDGARLLLDDVQVIGGWSARSDAPRRAEVQLQEGFHRLVVEHFETAFQAQLEVLWSEGTDTQPVPIPGKFLFYNPAELQTVQSGPIPEYVGALKGHTNSVTALSWSSDGRLLASSGEDRRVKLWKVADRKPEGNDQVHPAGVLGVALSPDGRLLASGAWDGKVRVWLVSGSTEMNVLDGHTAFVQSVAFSPDGKRLASASYDRTVRVWDAENGTTLQILSGHAAGVECVAWSPDGKLLVSASLDHTLRVWDAESGEQRRVLAGHADFVESAAFSPDSSLLASAGWDGRVKLWDLATGAVKATFEGHTGEAMAVAFSPDGKVLASGGSDAMVRLWHVGTQVELRVLPGHTARVLSVAFSKDGRQLASSSFDGSIRIWDVGTR
jgi:predicted Ser/Thr protein kinase